MANFTPFDGRAPLRLDAIVDPLPHRCPSLHTAPPSPPQGPTPMARAGPPWLACPLKTASHRDLERDQFCQSVKGRGTHCNRIVEQTALWYSTLLAIRSAHQAE